MNRKETWINDTLNSLEGIRRATSDPGLFIKVQAEALHPMSKKRGFKGAYYWSAAACITLLIALNILGALYYHQSENLTGSGVAAVATDYLYFLRPVKL